MCVVEFLRDSGYRVLEAADVAEAKDLLKRWRVDLVFSDINMPNSETGFALEKWVRLHYPAVKVLLTSGYPQNPKDTAGLLGPIIMKPYRCAALQSRIDHVLCDVKA
jgi:CheY-like chemotaxis protein